MKHTILFFLSFWTIFAVAFQPGRSVVLRHNTSTPLLNTNRAMLLPTGNIGESKLTQNGKNLTIIGASSLAAGGLFMGIGYGTMKSSFATDSAKFGSLLTFFGGAGLGVLGTGLLLAGGPMWAVGAIKDKAAHRSRKRVFLGLRSSSEIAVVIHF